MAGLEDDTKVKNVAFCEQNFKQKHNLKANLQSTSKTDLLFDIIPDLVRPKNFDDVADRNITDNKRKLFLRQAVESEESVDSDKDQEQSNEENNQGTSSKNNLYLIIALSAGGFLLMIGVILAILFVLRGSPDNAKLIAKAEAKCKEYVNLACSFQNSTPKSSDGPEFGKIVHGTLVPEGMLPHQVFILFPVDDKSKICGGSIVSEKFILTAAHCPKDSNVTDGRVMVGNIDNKKDRSSFKTIKKAYIHPNFGSVKFYGDIALLELNDDLVFSATIRPICLATKYKKHYSTLIVSGWGQTEDGKSSQLLRMAELQTDANTDKICMDTLGLEYKKVEPIGVCTAHLKQGANVGDSGGPLQVRLASECQYTWEQIGISSIIASKSYLPGIPTIQIFVRVDAYVPWIVGIVWPD